MSLIGPEKGLIVAFLCSLHSLSLTIDQPLPNSIVQLLMMIMMMMRADLVINEQVLQTKPLMMQ